MLTTTTLRRTPEPVHQPVTWLLPGHDTSVWLEEVCGWGVAVEQVRFHLLPDAEHHKILGALALPPTGETPIHVRRGQPYGRIGAGLFVPVDAVLEPRLDESEVRRACPFPVAVWHPAGGLVGFEPGQALTLAELLELPPIVGEAWNGAVAGTPEPPSLRSVRLAAIVSLAEIFGPESESIGSSPLKDLPSRDGEPTSDFADRIGRGLKDALSSLILGLAAHAPRVSRHPTWVDSVARWADTLRRGVARDLEWLRHKELHRLLDMLASNSEEALKHAISLAGNPHRGAAPPSAQLGSRPLDFNLSRLGGGGPADVWNVPVDIRSALVRAYRDAAMRELQLGRFRRAAYVFAELLGDLPAAADALKRGRHFREAALLYQQRLRNDLAAAECYVQGGLLHEALPIYEKLQRWLDVANLHARLGDRQAEEAAVRRAVEQLRTEARIVEAARLLEDRLQSPDEALELLASTWPGGPETRLCLQERFALLARHHRHTDARALLLKLHRFPTPDRLLVPLVEVLAGAALNWPNAEFRHEAADGVRVLAAGALHQRRLGPIEERALVRQVARIAPDDRLLQRDAARFSQGRPSAPRPATATAHPGRFRRMRVSMRQLPSLPTWPWHAGSIEQGFVQAVRRDAQGVVRFTRMHWMADCQTLEWRTSDQEPDSGLLFVPFKNDAIIARLGGPPLDEKRTPGGAVIGTPPWFPPDAVCAASSEHGTSVARVVSERIVVDTFSGASLSSSRDITDQLLGAEGIVPGARLVLSAGRRGGEILIGYGRRVAALTKEGQIVTLALESPLRGLVPINGSIPGWLAMLDRGLVWIPLRGSREFVGIEGAFAGTHAGPMDLKHIVILSESEGLLAVHGPTHLGIVGSFELPAATQNVIAVGPGPSPMTFATVERMGAVRVWEIAS